MPLTAMASAEGIAGSVVAASRFSPSSMKWWKLVPSAAPMEPVVPETSTKILEGATEITDNPCRVSHPVTAATSSGVGPNCSPISVGVSHWR